MAKDGWGTLEDQLKDHARDYGSMWIKTKWDKRVSYKKEQAENFIGSNLLFVKSLPGTGVKDYSTV